jgi:phosphatidylglycerol:prolipoprotein diacylglycerol transferase
MHPILFEIPGIGFPIRSFGVLVAGGIFLAIWIWGSILQRHGEDPEEDPARSSQVAVWIVIGILLGARLLYVVVESARYLAADGPDAATRYAIGHDFIHDPVRILFIWQGGLVMYGGLVGGVLGGLWAGRKHGLRMWNTLDTGLVAGFFGLAIGRWGCLLVGDDHGKVVPEGTELPFPFTVTVPSAEWLIENTHSLFPRALAGEVLWATQVWMSVNAVLVGLVGWWVLRHRSWKGQATAVMLVHYAITRFAIEMFRGDEIRGLWFGGTVSTSQLVSIGGLLLGLYLLVRRPGPPLSAGAVEAT